MVVFTSSRASWLLSLAVLGLACAGTREDPSPGDAPAPSGDGSLGSGGSGGGTVTLGGGVPQGGGSSTGFLFDDCVCAAIAESHLVPSCETCAELANAPDETCGDQRVTCENDTTECGLALLQLANNNCAGDPECTAARLAGLLDEESAALLFGYFSCLCGQCVVCNDSSAGGGGVGGSGQGGGSSVPAGACVVSPQ